MELKFIPFDYDHVELENEDFIKIFGRTEEGKTCCVLDYIDNFFYIIEGNLEAIKKQLSKDEIQSEIVDKNYLGNPVKSLRVHINTGKVKELVEKIKLKNKEAKILETDIKPITRYIIEKNIRPLFLHDIAGEILENSNEFNGIDKVLEVDIVLKLEKIKSEKEVEIKPKVISFDIETEEFEIGRGRILMIGLVSEKFKKVLTWKKIKTDMKEVEFVKDEIELLKRFIEIIKKESPDILTGYFTDNFDFPYIRARAEKLKVKLDLSRDGSKLSFSKGRLLSARIKGLVHIDIFRFIERTYAQYMESESLTLDEVASELLGENKLKMDHFSKKTEDILDHEWEEFLKYNLQDTELTYKLFQKIWPDIVGFTHVMQEPLFDVSRDGMSQHVEDYLIHNLKKFNEIVETKPSHHQIAERIVMPPNTGAFVLQPAPKLYEDLAMFDFTSYWPSIIVTFNLSKSTFLGEKKQSNANEVKIDNKTYYFSKKPGFFPELLKEVIEKRKQSKKELKIAPNPITQARSTAYKLLANASYGYLGFGPGRYFSYEAQGATTSISRDFIKKIIEKTNDRGYTVIYADTDGFAFLLNKKSKKETLEYLSELNKTLPGVMELELEDFYKRGIFVTKRTGEFGAKKKYALINEENKLKIRGFETVRRDWCKLARELQNKVLRLILEQGNEKEALEITKDMIKKLQTRKIEKKLLIIKTQLKKPIEEYKAQTPHVIIAKRMQELGMPVGMGTLIEYFVAQTDNKKKGLVRDKAKLAIETGEYDIEYYINNQIIPAVDNIFQVFNVDLKEIASTKKQKKLADFK